MREILRVRPDAAKNSENELDEEVTRDQPPVTEVSKRIKMADIVALEFEARAAAMEIGRASCRERV